MKNRTLMGAAATSFAHLLGIKPGAAKSEDDKDDNKDKAEDEDAESDDDEDDKEKSKKSKKAKSEDDDDDASVEDDESDEDGDDEKKDDAKKAARASERARCARIIAHGIKSGTVEQAGVLAFDTALPASAAIATLNAIGSVSGDKKAKGGIGERMAAVKVPNVGASGVDRPAAGSPAALAAQMLGAYDRANGKASQ